jgi:protein-disulfide isomerase
MKLMRLQALMILVLASPASGQSSSDSTRELAAIRAELGQIKADLDTVRRQLGQVLLLLNQRPAQAAAAPTRPVRASVADAPILGRPDAPVTIVEFSDYQCPFCQRFFATTLPELKRDYIETGKVRYVFRDFPLDQLHPQARKAAEAAHCAGEHGRFWEMHDVMFQNRAALGAPQLTAYSRRIGLDVAAFEACLASGRYAARIERGLTDGAAAGVRGTPSFLVGKSQSGDIVEGTFIRGAQPVETFRRIIDQILAEIADQSAAARRE